MVLKFALRNVLRNKKRSFLTALTIFFAALLVGVAQGWINGMVGVYVSNFSKYQTGHVRVSTEEFIKREKFMPVDEIIIESEDLKKELREIPIAQTVEERIRFGILLGNKGVTLQAVGMGIDLEKSRLALPEKLKEGKIQSSGIYIGHELARKLGVAVGEELLIATKTSEGGLNGIKLPVGGIFNMGMMYDRKYFFIGLNDARRLLKLDDATTEIFLYGEDVENTEALKAAITAKLPEGLTAQTYKEQMGDFYGTLEGMKSFYFFIEILILFLASFVIINTMMMAIFERMREIGTMKALGMSDRDLFLNFTCEGALLGLAGGVIGAVVGVVFIFYLGRQGIDFTAQLQAMDMPFEYIIRPAVRFSDLAAAVIISVVVPTVAAMIPARHAKRLMPAEALRK